jgi:YVTN family beta-propeller protein
LKIFVVIVSLCLAEFVLAQQVPWATPDIPVSAHDRVYAADQTSNTVSVIDPSTDKLLGVIRLGDPVPGALSPLYKGELLVHGSVTRLTQKRLPWFPWAPILSP